MVVGKKQVSFVFILAILIVSMGFVYAGHAFWHPDFNLGGNQNCVDNDGDGYDNCAAISLNGDSKPKDCNDNNKNVNPGADEICGNGIDDDCDGDVDENNCVKDNDGQKNKESSSCSWTDLKNSDNQFGDGDFENPGSFSDVCERPVDVNCVADVPKESQMEQGLTLDQLQANNPASLINPNSGEPLWLDSLSDSWYEDNSAWGYSSSSSRTVNYSETGENVTCSAEKGVVCKDSEQSDGECDYNYRVKFKCCDNVSCLDKDSGKNISNSSSGIEYYTENGENKTVSSISDSCASDEVVSEVYCDENSLKTENISCSSNEKCVGGRCVKCNYTLVNSSNLAGEDWRSFRNGPKNLGFTNNPSPDNLDNVGIYKTMGAVRSSPSVSNGHVYIGSNDNSLYALNASNISQKLNEFSTGGWVSSSPAVSNGYVYVGSSDNKIYQLNASNLNPVNSFQARDSVYSSPAVSNGYVYVGSYDHDVYQLNASTMDLVNNFSVGDAIESSPVVSDEYVYIGSSDVHRAGKDKLYQLNATDMSLENSYSVGYSSSSPVLYDGHVYVTSSDNKIYQLNATDMSLENSYGIGAGAVSLPAASNGYIYVSSYFKFYKLNATDMNLVDSYKSSYPIVSAPSITDRYIYAGGNGGLFKLNKTDMSLIENYRVNTSVDSSPSIANGYIYFGESKVNAGKVYQLGTKARICDFEVSGSGQGGNSQGSNSVESTDGDEGLDVGAPDVPGVETQGVPEVQEKESQASFFERLMTGRVVRDLFN